MKIDKLNDNGNLIVTPFGRLDSLNAGDLQKVLDSEINDNISTLTIDMDEVDFVSSLGLRILVGAYKKMNGRSVILNNVNTSIMEVLRLSGLLKVFTVNGKA